MKPCLSMTSGRLRPATTDDLDDLLELLHDEAVRRYLCDDRILPSETVADMLAASELSDADGLGLWVIELKTDRFAGVIGLTRVSEEIAAAPEMSDGIEPVIALDPACWGRGIASETLTMLIAYARDTLGLLKLVAAVDEPNTRSHQLMKRCGFTLTGKMPGPANDLMLYHLLLITDR